MLVTHMLSPISFKDRDPPIHLPFAAAAAAVVALLLLLLLLLLVLLQIEEGDGSGHMG